MKRPFSNWVPSTATSDVDVANKPTPSESSSSFHLEKDLPHTSSRRSSSAQDAEKKLVEETALQEAEALDKLDDEQEYPHGAKLAIITASLCLSVFLMALVSLEQNTSTTEEY